MQHAITKLRAFVELEGTIAEAAAVIGISRSYLNEILLERRPPSRNAIQKIHTGTGGKVPAGLWFEERPGRDAARPEGEAGAA